MSFKWYTSDPNYCSYKWMELTYLNLYWGSWMIPFPDPTASVSMGTPTAPPPILPARWYGSTIQSPTQHMHTAVYHRPRNNRVGVHGVRVQPKLVTPPTHPSSAGKSQSQGCHRLIRPRVGYERELPPNNYFLMKIGKEERAMLGNGKAVHKKRVAVHRVRDYRNHDYRRC